MLLTEIKNTCTDKDVTPVLSRLTRRDAIHLRPSHGSGQGLNIGDYKVDIASDNSDFRKHEWYVVRD